MVDVVEVDMMYNCCCRTGLGRNGRKMEDSLILFRV